MRSPPIVALAGLIALAAVSAPQAAEARKPRRAGRLVVLSTTSGADIFIDGKRVGSVPRERPITLPAGPHTLRVELRGYSPSDRKVSVVAGKTIQVEADLLAFAGILLVETSGVTAEVVIDGKPQGPTPFDGDVTIGKRVIEVRAPGRMTDKRELVIKGGQLYPLSIDLKIDPNAPPPAPVASAETPPEVDDDADGFDLGLPEGWYKEPWVIIGAGAAVVVAIGAAVLLSAEDPPPSGPTPEQTVSVGAGYK